MVVMVVVREVTKGEGGCGVFSKNLEKFKKQKFEN
jgi:hypothetical protein